MGNPPHTEAAPGARATRAAENLALDVRYACRRLWSTPGFTALAVLTLALGIGANTAIFTLLKTVALRPLPYGEAERVVMLWGTEEKGDTTWLSASEVKSYARDVPGLEQLAAYTAGPANLTGGEEPERVIAAAVTPNLFATLEAGAAAGRTFGPGDRSGTDAVVLGHGLWMRRFGGDPGIVGRTIVVNGAARTVVGVMPARFHLPLDFSDERPSEIWIPLDLDAPNLSGWGNRSLIGVGRLRAGIDPRRASAEMRVVEQRWLREGLVHNRDGLRRAALPVSDLVLGPARRALFILLGAVSVVLLIACANVANLQLARSDGRRSEVTLRTALGATRGRLGQMLLTESALLSLLGAAGGVALAWTGLRLLVALHPVSIPRIEDTGLDPGVLGLTLAVGMATGLLFGIAPALDLSRPDLSRALNDSARALTPGRQRFRDALAVAQTALSAVLLIGAMLLVRSFIELRRVDLGFVPGGALTARVTLPPREYPQTADVIRGHRELLARIEKLPGVRFAGATRLLPLTGTIGDWSITVEGRPRAPGDNPNGDWQVVTPGYFEAMRIKLVRGRVLTAGDRETGAYSAVINETMAARYWPGQDAVGKRFHLGTLDQPWITVVGIVGRVRHNAVVEQPRAEMYLAHAQFAAEGASAPRGMTFVVRTAGDPRALAAMLRSAVRGMDRNLPVADLRTLASVADDALSQARFTTAMLGLFAALAVTLAATGIYGLMSLLVARRRQEIAIRAALGAGRRTILAMIVRRGLTTAAAGVGIGVTSALFVTRALAGLLYGVARLDPVTFALVPVGLILVALAASVVAAAGAARVDPMLALRQE